MEPIVNRFYGYLKEGKIMGFKCDDCKNILLPPRGICPHCGGCNMNWIQLSGEGRLMFASVGTHRLMKIDFIQGTVKLKEGPLVPGMVLIDDFDFSKPETIWDYNQADLPVMAEVTQNPQGVAAIAFRLIR